MSIQLVNLGNYPNDGSGDDLRTAFIKTNSNITELDNIKVESAINVGLGAPSFLDKQGTDLRFRTLKPGAGDSGDFNISISYDSDHITLTVVDSLQAVQDDINPSLGGNLNLNNFNIIGNGDIDILGDISANNFTGDLNGNIIVFDSDITIESIDSLTNFFKSIFLNGLNISGNHSVDPGITSISTVIGDGLVIFGDTELKLFSNFPIIIEPGLNVTGNISGNTITANTGFIGNLTGNVISSGLSTFSNIDINSGSIDNTIIGAGIATSIRGTTITATSGFTGNLTGDSFGIHTGNVIGQVSTISNHSIADLNDVLPTLPTNGQALVWNGVSWGPQTITSGVSRIIAGANITISPINGQGEVTINAASDGSFTGLNIFDFGNFKNIFTNPIVYLLTQVGLDFGTFTSPNQITVELGSF